MPLNPSSQPKELIGGVYDSFRRGDVAAVLASFADDIVWNEAENFLYADGNPYRGPQAVLDGIFRRLASEWEGFEVSLESVLIEGNRAAAFGRYRGIYKRTGTPLDAQFAHLWTVSGGEVTSFQQYADTLQFARVAGRMS